MRRYLALTLVLLLIPALLLLPGCSNGKSGLGLTGVRCCEEKRSILYAPQYVALSQGFFLEQGLDIEMTTGQGVDEVMAALLSDTADIGFAGPESTVYVYNQGEEDYMISFAQLAQSDGTFLVGRKPETDFKWENLRGRTLIGGRPGGVPEMTLEYVLKKNGLIPNQDVSVITNIQLSAVPGAFKGGTGDYAAISEPMASMLERERSGYVIDSVGVAGEVLPFTVYMARKSYIEKNPAVIQKFTNAIYKGQRWVNRHSPAEIASAVQPFFPDADLDILAKGIERYKAQNTWDIKPVFEPGGLDHLQQIIELAGGLEKTVDSKTLITRKFADQAMAEIK